MNADVLSNCLEQAIPIVREAGKLLHDLDFAETSRYGSETYRLIFAKRTGLRYLILTASPV